MVNIRRQEAPSWKYATVVLYGAPGVGKTRLAAQAPAPLIIDVEGGCGALTGDIASITAIDELQELINFLAKGQHPYKSVLVDGIDSLYAHVLRSANGSPREPRSFHADATQKLDRPFRDLLRLPMLKLITSHAKTDVETSTGDDGQKLTISSIRLNLPPAFRDTVESLADVVAYCFIGTKGQSRGKRLLLAQPAVQEGRGTMRQMFGKDRTGNFGDRPLPLVWEALGQGLGISPGKEKEQA